MGLLTRAIRSPIDSAVDLVRSFVDGPINTRDPRLAQLLGPGPTPSGARVTIASAEGLAAFSACVRLIVGTVSSVAGALYRRLPDGNREKYTQHSLSDCLEWRANPLMDAATFKGLIARDMLVHGGAFIEPQLDGNGRAIALYRLAPELVDPVWTEGGALVYRYTPARGPQVLFAPHEIVPILSEFSTDGITPRSALEAARNAFGNAIASDDFAGHFYGNAAVVSGVLEHPGKLSDVAFGHVRDSLRDNHTRAAAWTPLILEESMQFKAVSFNAEDAEVLNSRRWGAEESCRLLGVPPSLIGLSTTGATMTYTNIESEFNRYLMLAVVPLLSRIEAAFNARLIPPLERRQQFVEFSVAHLLRGDLATRVAAYASALEHKWLTVAEVRQKENLPPLSTPNPGGPA